MILGFTPLEWLFNTFFFSEFCVYLNIVLIPRFRKGWMYASCILIPLLLQLLSGLTQRMSIWRIGVFIIVVVSYCLIFFRDKPLRSIFAGLSCYVIVMLAELITIAVLYNEDMLAAALYEAPVWEQCLVWGVEIISGAVLYWIAALVLNRVRNHFTVREMLMYAFFPLSQILLIFCWVNAMRQMERSLEQQLFVLFVVLICLAADVGLFASMLRVSQRAELEMENRLLEAQVTIQQAHYSELSAQHENIRRMREEVAGHIRAMNELLVSGRNEEAAAYVTALRRTSYDRSLGICQHPVVDAYLNNAMQRAAETGVVLEISASVPADVSVADTDLVCTFGNLLDNAFEACEGQENASVFLQAAVMTGYLVITMKNSLGGEKEKKAHIQGLERGIGLRVLKDLAQKYDGHMQHGAEGDVFRTEIAYKL